MRLTINRMLARRVDWSEEEWTIAWDACPKDKQSYGQTDRNVREIADLIDRTPSAVSRAFGNLWGARSNGAKGLRNFAKAAKAVVDRYGTDYDSLHAEVAPLRTERIRASLTPRLEVSSRSNQGLIPFDELRVELRKRGLTRVVYFTYERHGSLAEGVGFVEQNAIPIAAIITEVILWIECRLARRRDRRADHVITRSRAWIHYSKGRISDVELDIIRSRLPAIHPRELDAEQRRDVAEFVSFVRGVREVEASEQEASEVGSKLSKSERAHIIHRVSRLIGIRAGRLCDHCLAQLNRLLDAAESASFRKALRAYRLGRTVEDGHPSQQKLDKWL
jgi:hypothetical protein